MSPPPIDSGYAALPTPAERPRTTGWPDLDVSARRPGARSADGAPRWLAQAGLSLVETKRRLELALWATGEAVWEWDERSNAVSIQCFHKAPEDWTNQLPARLELPAYLKLVHDEDRDATRLAWSLTVSGLRDELDVEHRVLINGQTRWIRVRGRKLETSSLGGAARMIGTLKDISQQRGADQSMRLMAHAFSHSLDAMVVTNAQWVIVEANQAFYEMVHLPPGSAWKLSLSDFMDVESLIDGVEPSVKLWRREMPLIDFLGRPIPTDVTLSALDPSDDSRVCHVVSLRDISERKRAAARLEWFAHYDPLTELLNRTALKDHLDRQLSSAPQESFVLMFIDLDGFKEVNDSLGHNTGDALLKEIALRLQDTLRHRAIVARWGGDEFVVVLHPPSGMSEALEVTQRLIARLSDPLLIGTHQVAITPSIGVALAPHDGRDASTLLRHADAAMYAAKDAGRNRCEFYRSDLDADVLQRMQLTTLLRQAADREEFHFLAQPKTQADGTVVGTELLVRWASDVLGSVSPTVFIPLAEDIGVIGQIGALALDRAAALAARIATAGLAWTVSVNLSSRQVADLRLIDQLLGVCRRHGIEPSQIELEVTESSFLGNLAAARQVLCRLHELGFRLALDDFGTGYSALCYLRDLPFDKVKIDRSFVRDIDTDERAHALVEGIVALCRTLGMRTVAEGVETLEQLDHLRRLGLDEYQGYLFAAPLPTQELLALSGPLRPASQPKSPR